MNTAQQPLIIIANESNTVHEIEPVRDAPAPTTTTTAPEAASGQSRPGHPDAFPQPSNDLANNDGSIVETLDTAFHQKPGVAEGINPSGSDRAGLYEERAYGQSDAAEEAGTPTDD